MAKINFGGTVEEVVTREEFPLEKAREVLKNEVVAVLGYGVQGPAQALNMRDNGINVIVGQRAGTQESGTKPSRMAGFPAKRYSPSKKLPSAARSSSTWSRTPAQTLHVAEDQGECLKKGDALYFSHGFSIVYKDQTGVIPPEYVDVILVAPKGSGTSVRANFLAGSGINASFAVHQDYTGAPPNAPWRWALPSARAICSRPPSRTKSTAT